MKKIACIIIILCALNTHIFAQKFRFGLTASPVFSWLSVSNPDYTNDGLRAGFQYGLLFDQTIGNVERYAFSSGILINYVSGGISNTDTTSGFAFDLIAKVQYIEIPLTLRLRSNEVNYITYYGQFGLTPGVTIKAKGEPTLNGIALDEVDLRDKDYGGDTYNIFNLSLTIGAGIEYSLTENNAIIAGLFFQNGFIDQINDDADNNNVLMKQLGVRIGVLF